MPVVDDDGTTTSADDLRRILGYQDAVPEPGADDGGVRCVGQDLLRDAVLDAELLRHDHPCRRGDRCVRRRSPTIPCRATRCRSR